LISFIVLGTAEPAKEGVGRGKTPPRLHYQRPTMCDRGNVLSGSRLVMASKLAMTSLTPLLRHFIG
jgi:hypothetical protein